MFWAWDHSLIRGKETKDETDVMDQHGSSVNIGRIRVIPCPIGLLILRDVGSTWTISLRLRLRVFRIRATLALRALSGIIIF